MPEPHNRRQLVHLNVTASPTAAWVWRQLVEATPWGRTPRFLIRDRDAVYGAAFVPRARRLGVETLLTPVRAPRANAIAERLVGTLRRECLATQSIIGRPGGTRGLTRASIGCVPLGGPVGRVVPPDLNTATARAW